MSHATLHLMHNDKLGGQHRGWGGGKLEQRVVISNS